MSEQDSARPEAPEIVDVAATEPTEAETIAHPGKIMRIGSMIKQLLEEVRSAELDEASRDRLADIYDTSLQELASTLSPDLRDELDRIASPFDGDDVPTGAELRVAQAQLVGWLEGLFQGIQAAMFAQQVVAKQQLEGMRRELGPPNQESQPPGTYL